jgi:hypothetical protein
MVKYSSIRDRVTSSSLQLPAPIASSTASAAPVPYYAIQSSFNASDAVHRAPSRKPTRRMMPTCVLSMATRYNIQISRIHM